MLEGLPDKQLSAGVEGEVPPQREHERNRQGPVGEGLVGCGLWGVGEGVGYFCERLEGGQGEEGAWGWGAAICP